MNPFCLEILWLFWPTLLVGVAAAVAGGPLGVTILLRRQALLALALPHVAGLGAAVGLRWLAPILLPETASRVAQAVGWPTLPPAVVATLLAVLVLGWAHRYHLDPLLVPAVYLAGLCLAVLLVSGSGQHLAEIQGIFTGIDVATAPQTATVVAPAVLACAAILAAGWRRWLLLAQSPTLAAVSGVSLHRWETLRLATLCVYTLLATHAVGVVLPLVLLLIPPAVVLPWAIRVPPAMAGSVAVGLLILAAGFAASVGLGWPLSQSVAAAGLAVLAVSAGLSAFRSRHATPHA